MTVTELREVLMNERVAGRRPAIVILSPAQFRNFCNDLPGKHSPFDTLNVDGIPVLVKPEILDLSEASNGGS